MSTFTGDTLMRAAQDALEAARRTELRVAGIDEWLEVSSVKVSGIDVGTFEAELTIAGHLIFRREALVAVRIDSDKTALENV